MPPTSIDCATYDFLSKRCTDQTEIDLLQNCYGKEMANLPSESNALAPEKSSKGIEKYVLNRDYG